MKFFFLFMSLLFTTSFTHSLEEGASTSPSPEGDVRMGADAAKSGTDITDKEIQAQEDKGEIHPEETGSRMKKDDRPLKEKDQKLNMH